MTNLRGILIEARDFVGKSRCSVGHSVSEVLDRAKAGPRPCLYCKAQAELHEKLLLAISQVTAHEPAAIQTGIHEHSCRLLHGDDYCSCSAERTT